MDVGGSTSVEVLAGLMTPVRAEEHLQAAFTHPESGEQGEEAWLNDLRRARVLEEGAPLTGAVDREGCIHRPVWPGRKRVIYLRGLFLFLVTLIG